MRAIGRRSSVAGDRSASLSAFVVVERAPNQRVRRAREKESESSAGARAVRSLLLLLPPDRSCAGRCAAPAGGPGRADDDDERDATRRAPPGEQLGARPRPPAPRLIDSSTYLHTHTHTAINVNSCSACLHPLRAFTKNRLTKVTPHARRSMRLR